MGDASLEHFWLQKLPPSVRMVMAGLSGSSLDALVERADRVMEAARGYELADVAAPNRRFAAVFPSSGVSDSPEPREVAVADAPRTTDARLGALSAQFADFTANRAPTRHAQQARTVAPSRWCYYHVRYGPDARKCRDPCTFVATTMKNPLT